MLSPEAPVHAGSRNPAYASSNDMLSTGSHLRALQTEGCCQAAAARWWRASLLLLLLLPLLCPFIVALPKAVFHTIFVVN